LTSDSDLETRKLNTPDNVVQTMIISVSNTKGGCSKSTTAVNLSADLSRMGKRVLLVDLDHQGAATQGLGIHRETLSKTMYDVMTKDTSIKDIIIDFGKELPNLDIAPSNLDLVGVELDLANQMAREKILKNKLNELKGEYQYIVLDNPPNLGLIVINSLVACDMILIPVQCEYYSLFGMSHLIKTINKVETRLGNKPDMRVLLTMYSKTNLCKQISQQIKDYFKDKVLQTIIPRNVRLAESPSFGLPICLYDPDCSGAEAYEKLAKEVLSL
jgi:chromosome partitioning protein